MVCNALIAGGRLLEAEQQATESGAAENSSVLVCDTA